MRPVSDRIERRRQERRRQEPARRLFADLSLPAKLLLNSLLTLGGVVVLTCGLVIADHYQDAKARLRSEAVARAELTAYNASVALQAGDVRGVQRSLAALSATPDVLAARLFDEHGTLVAEYTRENARHVVPGSEPAIGGGQRFRAEYLETYRPVLADHHEIGMLVVATDLTDHRFELAAFFIKAVLIAVIAMVVAYVLSAYIQRSLLAPLGTLGALMRRVSEEKSYDLRAPVDRSDELGQIAVGLNTVLDRIAEREASLRRELAERTHVQRRLDELSHYYPVTKLPNRHYFSRQFERILLASAKAGSAGGLMLIELHNLKQVNESLGHDAGDTLLLQLAKRLTGSLRESDVLCRLGGDEFALVVEEISGESHLVAIAEKLVAAARRPFALGEREIRVGVSIGIAVFPVDGNEPQLLIRHAETAVGKAKQAGKNTYCFFEPDMLEKDRQTVNVATELRRALEGGELRLYYQPQLTLAEGRLRGLEALLRWQHPERGLLLPGEFISLAEENDALIRAVSDWTLEAACAQIAAWRAAGVEAVPIAVNFSSAQMRDAQMPSRLHELLTRYGVPPEFIELEVAEGLLMSEPGAVDNLRELRKFGCRVALEHFGAGYSSLTQLKDLPFTAIKIDREFVHGVTESARYAAVTRAIVTLAADLSLDTVAEGVESTRQVEFLRAMGCRAYQGFCFSPAVSPEEAERFLTAEPSPVRRVAVAGS